MWTLALATKVVFDLPWNNATTYFLPIENPENRNEFTLLERKMIRFGYLNKTLPVESEMVRLSNTAALSEPIVIAEIPPFSEGSK